MPEGEITNKKQMEELILQSLEHELGGAKIYETALQCAVNHGSSWYHVHFAHE